MKMIHAVFAAFLFLPLVAHGQSPPASAVGEVIRLEIANQEVSSLRLEIFDGETAQRLHDTGLLSGKRLELAFEELPATVLEARSLKYELRAWDATGELVVSQISAFPQLEEEIFSINFEVIPAGTVFVGNAISLQGDVEVTGDLGVAGAVRTSELRDSAGNPFFSSCTAGSSIRTIQPDGTVVCEVDDVGSDNLGNHQATENVVFAPGEGLESAMQARFVTGPFGSTWFVEPGSSGLHRFGVRRFGTTSGSEFTIDENGYVGIFRFDPLFPLDVMGNARIGTDEDFVLLGSDGNANIELRGAGTPFLDFSNDPNPNVTDFDMRLFLSGDNSLTIDGGRVGLGGMMTNPQYKLDLPNIASPDGQGRANGWVTYSSARFKTNVRPLSDALAKLLQLRGVEFDWKAEQGGGHDMGFIAEEVGAVLPELVDWEENGHDAMALSYDGVIPLLVEALKEQVSILDRQRARIARLEALLCGSTPQAEGCAGREAR